MKFLKVFAKQKSKMTRKLFQYDKGKMKEALEDIEGGMSVKSASKKYGIPRTTLTRHKDSCEKLLPIGRKPVFTQEQENVLANWVINMAKAGFPVDKITFLRSVEKFKTSLNIKCEGSRNWYEGFLKRNKSLSLRSYQNFTKSRSSVTLQALHNWFDEVEKYLQENGHFSILQEPRRVFNADESAFYLNPKGMKVLAERGSRFVYLSSGNDEKENVTVLLGGNAAGELAPPMAVFRYKRMPEQLASSIPESWTVGRSENGWMTQETMYEYMANYFYPWLVNNGIELPIIFFLDGHVSHLSLELSDFCADKGIILVALYPNATHLMQPFDVAVFKGLKVIWKKLVQEWRVENDFRELKKHEFCRLMEKALQEFNKESLCNGFKKCGLLPWNRHAIKMPLDQEPRQTLPSATVTDPFREQLEKRLTETKLQSFRANAGPYWTGDVSDTSLYYLWLDTEKAASASRHAEDWPEWHDDYNPEEFTRPASEEHREDIEEPREENEEASQKIDGPREENEEPREENEEASEEIDGPREENEEPREETEEASEEIDGPREENEEPREETEEASEEIDGPREEIEEPREENEEASEKIGGPREEREVPKVEGPREEIKVTKAVNFIIPSPFKKNLLFGVKQNQPSTSKVPKVRLPAVISSPEAREYIRKKEQKKNELIKKRTELKEKREERKRAKEEASKAKKAEKKKAVKRKLFNEKQTQKTSDHSSDDESPCPSLGSSSGGEWDEEEDSDLQSKPIMQTPGKIVGEHVAVCYDGNYFPGKILEVKDSGAVVKAMIRNGKLWKWPQKEDRLFYSWSDIVCKVGTPKKFSKTREIYNVPEMENL